MARQGLPEDRVIISPSFDPPEARDEVIEIRRRVYHDPDGLREVLACAHGDSV